MEQDTEYDPITARFVAFGGLLKGLFFLFLGAGTAYLVVELFGGNQENIGVLLLTGLFTFLYIWGFEYLREYLKKQNNGLPSSSNFDDDDD